MKDAVDVKCTDDELIVTLVDGRRVSAPLAWFPRLLHATPQQRANWRLIGRGIGIHWDDQGNYKNSSDALFRSIGAYLGSDNASVGE